MQEWRVIQSGRSDAYLNMALDEAIALSVREGHSPPTIRFYGWREPSVSLGMFQPTRDIDVRFCERNGVSVVRRPTGGKAILHCDELTYSLCARNAGPFSGGLRETYRVISNALSRAFTAIGLDIAVVNERRTNRQDRARDPVCFHTPSFAEICCSGHKLVGSAQRRWPESFLQQGSIPYRTDAMLQIGIFGNSGFPKIPGLRQLLSGFDPLAFADLVRESFEEVLSMRTADGLPSDRELETASRLSLQKYQASHWLQKR